MVIRVAPAYSQLGREMDAVVAAATGVMEAFRALDLPICYSHRDDRKNPTNLVSWDEKLGTMRDFQYSQGACGGE